MNTSLNEHDHVPLPRLYGITAQARSVVHESTKSSNQSDARIQRIKLELAALQLQEMRLQIAPINEGENKDKKDWIHMTSVMCKSLELVLNHIKSEEESKNLHSQTRKAAAMLSQKQIKILQMVAKGMSNKSISTELNIKQSSINQTLSRVYKILGVGSRTQAVSYCNERGLI